MKYDNNQDDLEQRDIENALIFILYLLVVLGNIRFPGFIMAMFLYISTLWYFYRVGIFHKYSRLRVAFLTIYLQISLPLITVLSSINLVLELMKFLPNGTSDRVSIYILIGYYILAPIVLNLISFSVFKKHEYFSINQKPALELGRMLIWGITLTFSVLVITDNVSDDFSKVSFLIVMAPLLIFNYTVKVVLETSNALKEYENSKNNNN